MATRLETNFRRLLSRSEAMAHDKNGNNWRQEKYVGALQDLLSELTKAPGSPPAEILNEYKRRVDLLKGLTEAEKLSSASEKALATERLMPPLKSSDSAAPSRELHLQKKALFYSDMRAELLSKPSEKDTVTEDGVRQRKPGEDTSKDLDTVLKHHNQVQEKLAEEMVSLARNLKENARAANRIVNEDNKNLQETTRMADANMGKLKVESDRLEQHVSRSCSWWIWIMLIVVCFTFISMVLFMRMFPKR